MYYTYLRSFLSVLFYFLLPYQHLINQNHQRHRNDTEYYRHPNRHCQKHSYDLFCKKYTNLHDSLIPYIFSAKCITSYYSCSSASSLSEAVFSFASLPVFNFVTVLTSLSSLYVTVTCSPSSHRITSMISATDTS